MNTDRRQRMVDAIKAGAITENVRRACTEFGVLQHCLLYVQAVGAEWTALMAARRSFAVAGRSEGTGPVARANVAAVKRLDALVLSRYNDVVAALMQVDEGADASVTPARADAYAEPARDAMWRRPPLCTEGGVTVFTKALRAAVVASERLSDIIASLFAGVSALAAPACVNDATNVCVAYLVQTATNTHGVRSPTRVIAVSVDALRLGATLAAIVYVMRRMRGTRASRTKAVAGDLPGQDPQFTTGLRRDNIPLGSKIRVEFPVVDTGAGAGAGAGARARRVGGGPSIRHTSSQLTLTRCAFLMATDFASPSAAWVSIRTAVRAPSNAWCVQLGKARGTIVGGPVSTVECLMYHVATGTEFSRLVWGDLMKPGAPEDPRRVFTPVMFVTVVLAAARRIATHTHRRRGMATSSTNCPACNVGNIESCLGPWWCTTATSGEFVADSDAVRAATVATVGKEATCVDRLLAAFRLLLYASFKEHALILLPVPPPPVGIAPPPDNCFVAVPVVSLAAIMGVGADHTKKHPVTYTDLDKLFPLAVVQRCVS